LFAVLVFLTSACGGAPATAARDLPPVTVVASANEEVTVNVLELVCQSCAQHILAGCREIPGVASVDVDRKAKLITLHFDSSVTSRERVLVAVDDVVSTIP
jgi:copper chaperone CopZ